QLPVASVAFFRDGRRAATMGWNESQGASVHLWDVSTGKSVGEHRLPEGLVDTHLGVLPDGDILVCAAKREPEGTKGTEIWNTSRGEKIIATESKNVNYIFSLSNDGRRALIGGWDNVRILDLKAREVIGLKVDDERLRTAALSPDGRFAFIAYYGAR